MLISTSLKIKNVTPINHLADDLYVIATLKFLIYFTQLNPFTN